MAISLVRRLEPWWYTPESEKDAPEPARFLLAPLSQHTLLEVKYLLFREDATPQQRAEGHRIAAYAAIQGWENIRDADGKPVTFRRDALADLPTNLLLEIGAIVVTKSMLSEGEEKNSPSPSTSSNGRANSSADDATADGTRTASGDTPSRDAGRSKASTSKPANAPPSK